MLIACGGACYTADPYTITPHQSVRFSDDLAFQIDPSARGTGAVIECLCRDLGKAKQTIFITTKLRIYKLKNHKFIYHNTNNCIFSAITLRSLVQISFGFSSYRSIVPVSPGLVCQCGSFHTRTPKESFEVHEQYCLPRLSLLAVMIAV